jgi:protein O-GlcNAc transferase
MGDYTGAVSALERAVALNPNLAIAHSNLSGVYQAHGSRPRYDG